MEIKLNDFTNAKEDPEALFEILEKLGKFYSKQISYQK